MIDDLLSSPVRLRICGYLAGCEEADFAAVQEYCGLSASNLSKQVTTLLDRDYVALRKVASGRYTKTRLSLTTAGSTALSTHVAALREIADRAAAGLE